MNERTSALAELASESEQIHRLQDELRQSKTSIAKKIAAVMVRYHIDFRELREFYREQVQATRPTTGRHRKRADRYRDPATGSTWSGVGKTPRWLRGYLDEGRSKEEFLDRTPAGH